MFNDSYNNLCSITYTKISLGTIECLRIGIWSIGEEALNVTVRSLVALSRMANIVLSSLSKPHLSIILYDYTIQLILPIYLPHLENLLPLDRSFYRNWTKPLRRWRQALILVVYFQQSFWDWITSYFYLIMIFLSLVLSANYLIE